MPSRGRNRPPPSDIWYRAEVVLWEANDITFNTQSHPRDTVEFVEFPIVRRTPKGVYIRAPYMKRRLGVPINMDPDHCSNLKWISNQGRKRFAYPSKDLALRSLKVRKRMYLTNTIRRRDIAQRQKATATEFELPNGD